MNKAYLAFILIAGALFSCEKPEGEGGNSAVKGKVIERVLTPSGLEIGSHPATEERVYIIYGAQDSIYDDWMRTSHTGEFMFKDLRKGNYSIVVYSECTNCLSGSEPKVVSFEITENNQEVTLDEISIDDYR